MSDLEKRLDQIEQKIDASKSIPSPYYDTNTLHNRNDEIDLRELWSVLWLGKWWIVGVTLLFSIAGVFYALSLPDMYKSEGIYAPTQKQGSGALGGQFGGLASIVGVSLGGQSNDVDQAIALIRSSPFLEGVINEHNLKPMIMAVKGWNRGGRELIWDEEVFNPASSEWLREPPRGRGSEPSTYEVYKKLKKSLEVKKDKKTELITIMFLHVSPDISKKIVDVLAEELNNHFRLRDITSAERNLEYLKRQIEQTSIVRMQEVFYEMIEEQLKNLMLAEAGGGYLIRPVVIPVAAEERSSPNRLLILILFILVGGVIGVLVVFGLSVWRPSANA